MKCYIHDDTLKRLVVELYVAVFQFLTGIMTGWYKSSWKRLRSSFDRSSLKELVDSKQAKIQKVQAKIRDACTKCMAENINHLYTRDQALEDQRASEARIKAHMDEYFLRLGATAKRSLIDQCISESWEDPHQTFRIQAPGQIAMIDCLPSRPSDEFAERLYLKEDIKLHAWHLQEDFQDDLIALLIERALGNAVKLGIFQRLQQWNQTKGTQTLWIHDKAHVRCPSKNTLLSAFMVHLTRQAKVPVAAYFCEIEDEDTEPGGLIKMLYSLIFQIISALADDFRTTLDFSKDRFTTLDRSRGSVHPAIALLKDLLTVCPPYITFIIDGLQILDNGNFENLTLLRGFVHTLHSPERHVVLGSPATIKTLYTTDGYTDAFTSLGDDEVLNATTFVEEDEAFFNAGTINVGFL